MFSVKFQLDFAILVFGSNRELEQNMEEGMESNN